MRLPKKVEKALQFFVSSCKKKFGKDLVSIVLFGSYARGNWKEGSDVDLLVIVRRKLPPFKRRYLLLEDAVLQILEKHRLRFMPIISSVEELDPHYLNPLILGVLVGHRVLFGKEFWKNFLSEFEPTVRRFDPVYVEGERQWRIKDLMQN